MNRVDPSTAAENAKVRWGDALGAGFSLVPDVLVRNQARLGLTPLDLAIILNILIHWWSADELPFPRPTTIGSRIGVSSRSVERRLIAMEQKGLLVRMPAERHAGLAIRRFDLGGLVGQLQALARADQAYAIRQSRRPKAPTSAVAQD